MKNNASIKKLCLPQEIAHKAIPLYVLTIVHEWIFQLWTREADSIKVLQHLSRASRIHYIAQTQIQHPVQERKYVRSWFLHCKNNRQAVFLSCIR